jgi:class I fructose-bisphosphate aldolase/fructose-bisphosphate aldolase/2-amino-3,7-dideoxy-D-threo-hept-6-ulosonate synthase
VDILKTNYTGSPDTFRKVVEACPARVVVAGGEVGNKIEDYLKMTRDIIDVGGAGVTYGRFVWEYKHVPELVRVLNFLIHENGTLKEAGELLKVLTKEK